MHDEQTYIVTLSQPESFDLQKLPDLLASFLSMPRMDVVMQLKRTWGLLHSTNDMNEAQQLQAKLSQAGLESFVLDESEIKEVPAPMILKEARVESAGLVFKEGDQEKSLPWDSFGIMCAGQVLATTQVKKRTIGDAKVARRVAETGLTPLTAVRISHARLKGKEVVEKKTSTSFLLDLIAGEGSESIRILGESFNYSYLKERMGYNVPMNFKNLYTDICKFLPSVIKNQGAQAMEANDMAKMRYTDVRHFENERRWLIQLVDEY